MKKFTTLLFVLLLCPFIIYGQVGENDFKKINSSNFRSNKATSPTYRFDVQNAFKFIKNKNQLRISLPNPDGAFESFIIHSTNIITGVNENLKLNSVKTFKGQAEDDNSTYIALTVSAKMFSATVLKGNESFNVSNNINGKSNDEVIVKSNSANILDLECNIKNNLQEFISQEQNSLVNNNEFKRQFKIAITATSSFGQMINENPTKEEVFNNIVDGINSTNLILNRDLGIELVLIKNYDIIFTNPENDVFIKELYHLHKDNLNINEITNLASSYDIIDTNQELLDQVIGNENYDIGHVVAQRAGGGIVTRTGSIAYDSLKAKALTGGGSTDIIWNHTFVHELGHQLGASHTTANLDCQSGLGVEPNSGTSFMGYPTSSCARLDPNHKRVKYFHPYSIAQIHNRLSTVQSGVQVAINNDKPEINTGESLPIIPKNTPFILRGAANDSNFSSLTYNWSQMDIGGSNRSGYPDCKSSTAALFKFQEPTTYPYREFPNHSALLNSNQDSLEWDVLPCTSRELNFAFVVRDNQEQDARISYDNIKVQVGDIGPLAFSSVFETTSYKPGEKYTLKWETNGTESIASKVDILLSVDGGKTYTLYKELVDNANEEFEITFPKYEVNHGRFVIRKHVDTKGYSGDHLRAKSTFYAVSNEFKVNSSNYIEFTDINLKMALLDLGIGSNGQISIDEANNYSQSSLILDGKNIYNLDGLEYFKNVKHISCKNNNIVSTESNPFVVFPNIIKIDLSNNLISYVDLSQNEKLTSLVVSNNDLTEITINQLNNLQVLDVSYNKLSKLDLSYNTMLVNVLCNNNLLENLNVANGNNDNLNTLDLTNNKLGCIKVDNEDKASINSNWFKDQDANWSSICDYYEYIDFPDDNFKNALVNYHLIDKNKDEEISIEEAKYFFGIINIGSKSISDLTGIEYFKNITTLYATRNKFETINLTKNINLETIKLGFNTRLKALNIANLNKLKHLSLYKCSLQELDLSTNVALNDLRVPANKLQDLNLENQVALEILNCSKNNLQELDLSNNINLEYVRVVNTNLQELDLSKQVVLRELYCGNDVNDVNYLSYKNNLQELDLSNNTNLEIVKLDNGSLQKLDLRNGNNELITNLSIKNNKDLSCITVDNENFAISNDQWVKDNTATWSNSCDYNIIDFPDANFKRALLEHGYTIVNDYTKRLQNGISKIDIGELERDYEITVGEAKAYEGTLFIKNQEIVDLKGIEYFTNIKSIVAHQNYLSSIDLSRNVDLETLIIAKNQLHEIDLSNNVNLRELNINKNFLTTLDIEHLHNLEIFNIYMNKVEHLDLSNNSKLTSIGVASNNLYSLNLANGNNVNFTRAWVSGNPYLYCVEHDEGYNDFDSSVWRIGSRTRMSTDCNYSFDNNSFMRISEQLNNHLEIYPQPVEKGGLLTIQSPDIENVKVLDILGKEIQNHSFDKLNIVKISTERLSIGMYFFVINNNEVHKIIIK